MAWRNCKASVALIGEINAKWPGRDRASDGTIGDASHATRSSDHNPWVIVAGQGVVRARDIDKDGIDANWLAEHLRQLGAKGDPRLAGGGYVIFNRRITNPDFRSWRVYIGSNPHTAHLHVSFSRNASGFDSPAGWGIAAAATPAGGGATAASLPTLRYGMRNNPAVAALQRFCNAHGWRPALPLLPSTGNYLDQTRAVVEAAQAQMGVTGADADGSVCGPRTNAALWARGYRG